MNSIRSFISKSRYNYYVSGFLVFSLKPLFYICNRILDTITRKIKVNGFSVKYDGLRVIFPKNVGVGFLSAITWKGEAGFEPFTWKAIRSVSKDAHFFFDIGSHFGFYSVLVQKINPNIVTRCYEPIEELFEHNQKFHEANGTTNQHLFRKAISNETGPLSIQIPKHQKASEVRSASIEKDFFFNQKFETESINIVSAKLDDEINGSDYLNKRVVVKIDIEGHEWAAIKGGMSFFKNVKPVIICEIDKASSHFSELVADLQKLEYRSYAITKDGLFRIGFADLEGYIGGRDFLLVQRDIDSYCSFEKLKSKIWNDAN